MQTGIDFLLVLFDGFLIDFSSVIISMFKSHYNLVEPCDVRWLSLEMAVTTFYKIWAAVVMTLESEATLTSGGSGSTAAQAKAKGILDRVRSYIIRYLYLYCTLTLPYSSEINNGNS